MMQLVQDIKTNQSVTATPQNATSQKAGAECDKIVTFEESTRKTHDLQFAMSTFLET